MSLSLKLLQLLRETGGSVHCNIASIMAFTDLASCCVAFRFSSVLSDAFVVQQKLHN